MSTLISVDRLVELVNQSELDPTIKEILIRDIKSNGATEFLLEQIIAYCDNAAAEIRNSLKNSNPPSN